MNRLMFIVAVAGVGYWDSLRWEWAIAAGAAAALLLTGLAWDARRRRRAAADAPEPCGCAYCRRACGCASCRAATAGWTPEDEAYLSGLGEMPASTVEGGRD